MKNRMKMLMVVGVFAIFAFAPVNETKTVVTPTVEAVEVACVEDDALVCTIRYENGGVEGRCWFCNCAKFAENLH